MIKRSPGRMAFDAANYCLMLFFSFLCVAPILHIFFMSISDPGIVNTFTGIMLWPRGGTTSNGYRLIARNPNIVTGYLNTLFYVVFGTAISATMTLVAGYVLSRKRFKPRNALMGIITFTMLFSGGLIPFYLTVNRLGLIYTRWSIILPSALSVMNIIIMRTGFLAVPDSLEESARLDGAGDVRVLFQIMLPAVQATFAVLVLFYAVGQWNGWFNASIFLRDRSMYPLQLILREMLLQNQASAANSLQDVADNLDIYKPLIKYATIIVATVPILCIYPFVQKYFVKGVMVGSIKG
jgi:ABC-type sugar transport system, permease component